MRTEVHRLGGGVDLSAEGVLARARRRRKLAERRFDVDEEVGRLTKRASWLERKAARLPLRSHGRAKLTAEARGCELIAETLASALTGERTPQLSSTDRRQASALRLLAELQAA